METAEPLQHFLDVFTQQHLGWLSRLEGAEAVGSDGVRRPADVREAELLPLRLVRVRADGAIEIALGREAPGEVGLVVARPTAVALLKNASGADEGLRIDSAHGPVTLRFRTSAKPEMLDGLDAKE